MKFKLDHLKAELDDAPLKLQEVMNFADFVHKQETGKELVVTCVLGDAQGRVSATHKEHRAVDCRVEMTGNFGKPAYYITETQAQNIAERVNKRFPISEKMQTCIVHRAGWKNANGDLEVGPLHMHFQISREQAMTPVKQEEQ